MTISNENRRGLSGTNTQHAETMWTSVLPATPIKNESWKILERMTQGEIEALVRASMPEVKRIMEQHKSTFDSSISNAEMLRRFPRDCDCTRSHRRRG